MTGYHFSQDQERQKRRCVPYWEKSHNLSMLMGLLEKKRWGGEPVVSTGNPKKGWTI
jgi:hypothetical protein